MIAEGQTPPSAGFVALIEMRESDPFAKQKLAMHMSGDAGISRTLAASYLATTDRHPSQRPLSPRNIIDHWGYRVSHCSSVLSGLVGFLGEPALREPHRDFWLRAAVVATYAGVLAEALKAHADWAFAGSLLRSTALFLLDQHQAALIGPRHAPASLSELHLWDRETAWLGGSHLDLARRLGEHWELSSQVLTSFDASGESDSLPDLIMRATAAAERHGFHDRLRTIVPAGLRPDREPIADAYFRNGGGTPEAFLDEISGMLALTPLVALEDVA